VFEPNAQGSSLFRDRGLRPPTGEGRSDALPVDARNPHLRRLGDARSVVEKLRHITPVLVQARSIGRSKRIWTSMWSDCAWPLAKLARMDFADGVEMSGNLGHSRHTLSTRWKKWSEI
jgi:hypothetical protein